MSSHRRTNFVDKFTSGELGEFSMRFAGGRFLFIFLIRGPSFIIQSPVTLNSEHIACGDRVDGNRLVFFTFLGWSGRSCWSWRIYGTPSILKGRSFLSVTDLEKGTVECWWVQNSKTAENYLKKL